MQAKIGDKFLFGGSTLTVNTDKIDGIHGHRFVFVGGKSHNGQDMAFSVKKSTITKKNGWARTK